MADDERLIETRDPSFWKPCADSEWAYVGVPLSNCEAVSGRREVKKIDCTGVLSESVQAFFQEIVNACVEEFNVNVWLWPFCKKRLRTKLNERATQAVNNLVCLGSGERPSLLMRERMRRLVSLGTWWPGVALRGCFVTGEDDADELLKCLEESNRPKDKALLYILLGKFIIQLQNYLGVCRLWRTVSFVNKKLQCATRQRALLSCFHAFDAGAEDFRFGVNFHGAHTVNARFLIGLFDDCYG